MGVFCSKYTFPITHYLNLDLHFSFFYECASFLYETLYSKYERLSYFTLKSRVITSTWNYYYQQSVFSIVVLYSIMFY